MLYFTSDHHFYHEGILGLCGRPFKNMQEMHRRLVRNHNEIVTPEDTVYFIGDFSMCNSRYKKPLSDIVAKLNGTKHLILGNHDNFKPFDYVDMGFTSVHTSLVVEGFILHHDPCASCIDRDSVWLCGHVHDLFETQSNVINVGVDVWNYTPVPLTSIQEMAASLGMGV